MRFFSVHTSFPDTGTARTISKKVIEEKIAACVNLFSASSIYWWRDKIEEEPEVIGIFKTSEDKYPELEQRLSELHPYQVPMIVALPVQAGAEKYLSWLAESLGKEE